MCELPVLVDIAVIIFIIKTHKHSESTGLTQVITFENIVPFNFAFYTNVVQHA